MICCEDCSWSAAQVIVLVGLYICLVRNKGKIRSFEPYFLDVQIS